MDCGSPGTFGGRNYLVHSDTLV
jgi:hypothetical protein